MPEKKEIIPTEFAIKGVSIRDVILPSFLGPLEKEIGRITLVNLGFNVEKFGEMVVLWHRSSDDAKEGIVTIGTGNKKIIDALAKTFGIEG